MLQIHITFVRWTSFRYVHADDPVDEIKMMFTSDAYFVMSISPPFQAQ